MAYSTDADLVAIRPDILSLGVADWSAKHDEAESIINRVIEYKWYRNAAEEFEIDWRDAPFDATKLTNATTQLTRLSSYKTLEIIYEYLMQASADVSAFEKLRNLYHEKFKEELKDVLGAGLDYDWTDSGAIGYEEKSQPAIRRLKRM